MTKTYSRHRTRPLTEEGLIPLHHLWYRSDRVVEAVCADLCMTTQEVYTYLYADGGGDTASARRWTEMASGRQEYVSLPVVDRLLVHVGMNLTADLGEADIHSSCPPLQALRLGHTLTPPPADEQLLAA